MEDLTIVYKGANSNALYTAYYDGSKWHGDDKISSQPGGIKPESNSNPGVVVFNNWLYLLYKGASSNALYTAWFDGNKWDGDVKISDMNGGVAPKSNYSPNIVMYKGLLYTVYKAAQSNALCMAWFDGTTWYGGEKISDMEGDISPKSSDSPGMVVFGDKIYIVYKAGRSSTLYTAVFDGFRWSGDTKIKDQGGDIDPRSSGSPGAVLFDGMLYIVYKGASSNKLYSAWYDGSKWSGDKRIKGQGGKVNPESSGSPNAEVYDDKLYVIYKGANSDMLYSAWFDGKKWLGDKEVKNQGGKINPESSDNPGISITAVTPTANEDWMRHLPDSVFFSEINIPGSHDAVAINTSVHTPYACHNHSISDQLKYGIRLLDVRLQVNQERRGFDFMTCHGSVGSGIGVNTYQTFPSLLDECKNFLESHPSEVVLMSLKVDDWSNTTSKSSAKRALVELLRSYPTISASAMQNLGHVRGKIFLFNRIDNDFLLGAPIGWSDNTGGSYAKAPGLLYEVYVQDRYRGLSAAGADAEKFDLVKNAFLKKKKVGRVVWNFASATWYGVFGVYVMDEMLNYFGAKPASERLSRFGWTLLDYPFRYYNTDTYGAMNIVQLIIASNSKDRYAGYEKAFQVVDDGHDEF